MALSQERSRKAEEVPYFRYAFNNLYNYTLMSGVAATAVLTQQWWLVVVGAGVEAIWMVLGPDSRLLRKVWFDKVHEENLRAQADADRAKVISRLPEWDAGRVRRLDSKRADILRLCEENRNLAMELLATELGKLAQLTTSFVDLIASTRRYEEYLAGIDVDQLEREMRAHKSVAENSDDDGERTLAKKNLAILMKRREKLSEIQKFVAQAQGQMHLIENTFELLADQIVTMSSPKELGGQLDELMDGVEAVKSSARETEAMMEPA